MRRIGITVGAFGALVSAFAAFEYFPDFKARAEFNSILELPETQKIARDIAKERITNTWVEVRDHPRIQQIWVNGKGENESFTLGDGKVLWKPASVLWGLLYPAIVVSGFLLPWAAVRLLTWIVSGFIVSSPPHKTVRSPAN
jgi:hypothetical protein